MKQIINLDLIKAESTLQKAFANAFYNAIADKIFMNFMRINNSRDKENEIFRWRFAINLSLITEADLLNDMIENFAKTINDKNKSTEEINLFNDKLRQYCELYKSKKSERNDCLNLNQQIKAEGITLDDIDVDFEKMVEIYKSANEEFKDDLIRNFYQTIGRFEIKYQPSQPTGSAMGE